MWKGFLEINFYDYLNIKNVQGQIFGLFVKFLVWQCDVRFFSLVLFDLIYIIFTKSFTLTYCRSGLNIGVYIRNNILSFCLNERWKGHLLNLAFRFSRYTGVSSFGHRGSRPWRIQNVRFKMKNNGHWL